MRSKDYLLQIKKNKHGNTKTVLDGITFHSKKEANRYQQLKYLQKAGVIKNLELQPEFVILNAFVDIDKKKHREIKYIADFRYWDNEKRQTIVEDVKGMKTEVYKIKKKLFLSKFAYHFLET